MTHFEQYHGYTNNLRLVRTNRFDRNLARITNQFILKNPFQIKKEIVATKNFDEDPLYVLKAKSQADAADQVQALLDTLNSQAQKDGKKPISVYLLGRYRFNEPEKLSSWQKMFVNLEIKFITAHSSKGLEADKVIVLDVVSGQYGFPSLISDDPVLRIVMRDDETYPHAEERRLMYVALTRTRSTVHVVTQKDKISPFVVELEGDLLPEQNSQKTMRCPQCSGEVVERKGPYGEFYACKNFPNCTWKKNIKKCHIG